MNRRLAIALFWAAATAASGADPHELWERAVKAKGGRERLRGVHALAVYLKPANVVMAGPLQSCLFVFPDRYFEWRGRGSQAATASLIVDAGANRVSRDANGRPRTTRPFTQTDRDQLSLYRLVYLLETAGAQPEPLAVDHNSLMVQLGGRVFRLFLNKSNLPARVYLPSEPGLKDGPINDYRMERYHDFQGISLPARVTSMVGPVTQWTWDVDYEIDPTYNPKLFARQANLDDGPEPWRLR